MRVLDSVLRPVVQFDATNSEHRALYAEFLKTKSWAHCKVQFDIGGQYLDLPGYINDLLLGYYMKRDAALVKKQVKIAA